jgi:DNA recombination protein RmuC
MNTIHLLIGSAIGFIISCVIFYLRNKAKNVASVSKQDYEALNAKCNETNINLRITGEKLTEKEKECANSGEKIEAKDKENNQLYSKVASAETLIKEKEQKISELFDEVSKQKQYGEVKQVEINSLNQQAAELKASNKSALENLNEQKERNSKQENEVSQLKEKLTIISSENSSLTAKNTSLTENNNSLKEESKNNVAQIKSLSEQSNSLNTENSALKANNKALSDKLETQKNEIVEIQKTAHLQFEKIANQILEEKSGKFTETNKANIEAILKPLGENIDNFKKKVEETYDKESKQRFSLEEKVKELVEQTNKVSSEANNLASALKGQTKKQGNWGEMILESILQQSGLVKNREYFLQQTIKDEEGNDLRPDVLVKLPDNRIIIIDSKVSLVSYDRYCSASTQEEQAAALKEHLNSVYGHIDGLSKKQYDNIEESLDFTMMFVPIEPAYLIAIQSDSSLWAYAYSKRILLISPTNLIACLKMMVDLWKREMQSRNAMEIVKRGELLYEKFVTFVSTLEDVGKHINKTQQSYSSAINQLNAGNGNLVRQAMKLKDLGLKSNKEIPVALLPLDSETDVSVEIKQIDA